MHCFQDFILIPLRGPTVPTGGRVSVGDLLREARRGIKYPLGLAVLFVAFTCLYLWIAAPLYVAKITITARRVAGAAITGSNLLVLGALGALPGSKKLTNYGKLKSILIPY